MSTNKQESKSDNEWIVHGRVCTIIRSGQKVYVYFENKSTERIEFPFEIAKIRFYNQRVTELTEGYMCELILKGGIGCKVRDNGLTNAGHDVSCAYNCGGLFI